MGRGYSSPDDAIKQSANARSKSQALVQFAEALAQDYQSGADAPDPKAIESMAAQAEPADRIMIYCVARDTSTSAGIRTPPSTA